ncbi:hypothetical protein FOA52_001240 [Chlamydomonas sp. UWO 241]|nr:hypothetical protein FOA52_001240 [Chlamydomonas sp. UWO 241]
MQAMRASGAGTSALQHQGAVASLVGEQARRRLEEEVGVLVPPAQHNPHKRVPCDMAGRALDIVIAYYEEDAATLINWLDHVMGESSLASLPTCVWVYHKGTAPLPGLMEQLPQADYFVVLPNIGREGHSYLAHLTSQYGALAPHTLFTQGVPNNYDRHFRTTLHHFKRQCTEFLCLGSLDKCSCANCGHYKVRMGQLASLYKTGMGVNCSRHFRSCQEGQFLVSRGRIAHHSLATWSRLTAYLEAGPGHWINDEFLNDANWQGTPQENEAQKAELESNMLSRDSTYFLHVLERAWSPLFRCVHADMSPLRIVSDAAETGMFKLKVQHCGCHGGK